MSLESASNRTAQANAVDALDSARRALRDDYAATDGAAIDPGHLAVRQALERLADATGELPSPGACHLVISHERRSAARVTDPNGWLVQRSVGGASYSVQYYCRTHDIAQSVATAYRAGYIAAGADCRITDNG